MVNQTLVMPADRAGIESAGLRSEAGGDLPCHTPALRRIFGPSTTDRVLVLATVETSKMVLVSWE